jgi:endoglucanase
MRSFVFSGCIFIFLSFFPIPPAKNQNIVEKNGLLQVQGNRIVNRDRDTVCLAGHSFFWSNIGWGGIRFYNADVVNYLADAWEVPVIRVSMGVEADGGYIANPVSQKELIAGMIDAAIAAGIYIIVDWHSHQAQNYQKEAQAFFGELARTYGGYENLIYEIYNEPTQVSWSAVIKPYCKAVIDTIRRYDPDNLIIAGTPNWSQYVDEAANDPIKDTNIAYSLHFYAATHKQWLRDRATNALKKNAALIITEWGTCEASGSGIIDQASVNEWMDFCRKNRISHLNWALNDKNETASLLKIGVSVTGGWTQEDLTASGLIVREILENWPGELQGNTSLPGEKGMEDIVVYLKENELVIKSPMCINIRRISLYDLTGVLLFEAKKDMLQGNSCRISTALVQSVLILRGITDEGVFSRILIR